MVATRVWLTGAMVLVLAMTTQAALFVDTFDSVTGDAASHGYTVTQRPDGTAGADTVFTINPSSSGVLRAGSTAALKDRAGCMRTVESLPASEWTTSIEIVSSSLVGSGDPLLADRWHAGVMVADDAALTGDFIIFKQARWLNTWYLTTEIGGTGSSTALTGLPAFSPGDVLTMEGNADGTFNFLVNGSGLTNQSVSGLSSTSMTKFGVFKGCATDLVVAVDMDNLTMDVPEPTTLGLLVVGGVMACYRRKRR